MIHFTKGDIFVVTGASSGLGEETAKQLISLGATVIAIARNTDKLELIRENLEIKENFFIETYDFSDLEKIVGLFKSIAKKYGKLSGVVHFAGVSQLLPIRATSIKSLKEIFDINFFSSYEIIKAMNDKRVRNQNASILLVSSISSLRSFEGLTAYGSSKGAINSLVISSALELSKNNTRVNSIVPGHVETGMTEKMAETQNDEYKQELINSYPLGAGNPKDIANLSIFLLSDKSKWITGQNITIDGGRTLI